MQDSRIKNSVRNSIWGTVVKLMATVFPFIFRTIIIRYIGAAYIGLNGLFKSIFAVLHMTDLGFGTSIVFMMYKPIAQDDKAEIRRLLSLMRKIYRIIGAIILVVGLCILPFLDKLVKNDTGVDVNIHLLYCLYLFHTVTSYWLFAYRSSLITAHQRSDIIHRIVISCDIVKYILQAAALYFVDKAYSYYVYVVIYALTNIPANLLYYIVSKKMYPDIFCEGDPRPEHIATLKAKIMPLMWHRIGGKVIISIDDLIISMCLGVTMLTKYDNYYYVISAIVSFLTVFRQGILASFGNKLSLDSLDSTYQVFKRTVYIWISIVGLCAACLAGLYQPFVLIWVGEKYLYEPVVMLSLVLYFFLWQFRYIGVAMKDSAGLWEPDRYKPIIGMILNFFGSWLMVKLTNSVLGVLYPTMVIMLFIYFPWETRVLFKDLFKRDAKEYLLLVGHLFLATVCSVAASFFVGLWIGEGGLVRLLVRGAACAAAAVLTFVLTTFMRPEFREILQIGLKMLKKNKLLKR